MNLYKISQTQNNDWDTYDSAVVAAETETEARCIYPGGYELDDDETSSSWCPIEFVSAELIGKAVEDTKSGVIVASFNAG